MKEEDMEYIEAVESIDNEEIKNIIIAYVQTKNDKLFDEDWYRKQIQGLYLILESNEKEDPSISRAYVKEKLQMILSRGIGFHPGIAKRIGLYPPDMDTSEMEGVDED